MRTPHCSFLFAALISACGGSAPAPAPASRTPPIASSAASAVPAVDEAPSGTAQFVPQRLPAKLDNAVFSPDGRLLLVDTQIAEIFVLDAVTGQVRATRRACFQDYAFSPNGLQLVLADCDSSGGHLWDLSTDTLTPITVPRKHDRRLRVAIAPKGDAAAFYGSDHVAFVHLPDGALLGKYNHSSSEASNAAFSPDGNRLALGLSAGRVMVLESNGQLVWEQKAHEGNVRIAWSPKGDRVASGGDDAVIMWNAQKGISIARITPCGTDKASSVAWGPNDAAIAVGCSSSKEKPSRVVLLREDGGQLREVTAGGSERPFRVSFDPSGKWLGVTNGGSGHFVFDVASGKPRFEQQLPCASPDKYPFCAFGTFSADLARIAIGTRADQVGASRGIVVFDTMTGREHFRREGTEPQLGLTAGYVHKPVLATNTNRWLWDPARNEFSDIDEAILGAEGALALRVDKATKKFEVLVRSSGAARVLEMDPTAHFQGWAFSPKGTRVIALHMRPEWGDQSPEYTYHVWDAATGKLQLTSTVGPTSGTYDFSPDDRLLAHWVKGGGSCATQDPECFRVKVIDLEKGKPLITIRPNGLEDEALGFGATDNVLGISNAVYDPRKGKKLWATPARTWFQGFLSGTDSALLLSENVLSVVDARTGARQRTAPNIDRVVEIAANGSSLLVVHEGKPALLDMKTLEHKTLPFPLPESNSSNFEVFLSSDGRFVFFPAGEAVAIWRALDGRVLYRYGTVDPLYVTDEGIFDGTPQAMDRGALRLGPDVRRSRMVGLDDERAAGLHHSGLLADFMNDKPVQSRDRSGR